MANLPHFQASVVALSAMQRPGSAFFRFKEALARALCVHGSRDFSSQAAYERFVQDLVRNRNLSRAGRQQEQVALRPLPRLPLAPCRQLRVNVNRERSIQVLGKRYCVPSRYIGTTVLAQVRAETVEVYVGTRQVLMLPWLEDTERPARDYVVRRNRGCRGTTRLEVLKTVFKCKSMELTWQEYREVLSHNQHERFIKAAKGSSHTTSASLVFDSRIDS
jgi:hypothetical protein